MREAMSIVGAVSILPVLLLFPGYALGWWIGLCGFRRSGWAERAAWSIALSFATMPLLAYLAQRCGLPLVTAFCGVVATVASICLATRFFSIAPLRKKWVWTAAALVLGWIAFASFELVDLPWRGRLMLPVPVMDQGYRVAFLDALARAHGTPNNPLYAPGALQPLRYYYFWYALCSLPVRFLHMDSRFVLIASCIWSGLATAAMVGLYAKHFFRVNRPRMLAIAGISLLAVTGLDILPTLANLASGMPADADPEWWSTDQVTSWMDTFLWAPHHAAALVAILLALLLFWINTTQAVTRKTITGYAIAAVALASATGLSIYLGIAVALLLLAWCLWILVAERDFRMALRILLTGCVALVFLLPFVLDLRAPVRGAGKEGSVLVLSVREMIFAQPITALPWLAASMRSHPAATTQTVNAALLLPGYFVELGVLGLVLVFAFIRLRRQTFEPYDPARTLLFWTLALLVPCTFLRSTAITNNDFGFRAMLLPQFFLLMLGAFYLVQWKDEGHSHNWVTRLATVLVGVGVVSTLYQAVALRIFVPLIARHAEFAEIPFLTRDLKRAYALTESRFAKDSVVQWNPAPSIPSGEVKELWLATNLLYAHRQVAAAVEACGAAFGGDPTPCPTLEKDLQQLYSEAASSATAERICARWKIHALVVTTLDGTAWNDHPGWTWSLPPLALTPTVRILSCNASLQ
ncbi:hypothetical protein [Terriglobus saanensis]|uniref:Uncharacterized protein n=1 Tax=Terriglobus saanensis (strain ATCC BAA-1853 / DSM 23119 / SP1PR4) TaxID=401053 RepID=E8V5U4_TERSS|nr:hypothetical protein [Terriglobus saanensis]ADV82703.1 hypothetical protein AciPR4_1897 [Terriglobus saanensis SP1PR4]